jgi:hypothetical protein
VNLFSRKLLTKTVGCPHPDPLHSNSSAQQCNELILAKSSGILSLQEKGSPYEGNKFSTFPGNQCQDSSFLEEKKLPLFCPAARNARNGEHA